MDNDSQTTLFDMAYRALRTALYTALAIFSAILLGVSASRVRHTNTIGPRRFYDSIVVELIVTSVLALLWSLFMIFGICLALGGCLSFLTELIGLGILWVMFLVGAAIASNRYRNLGYCRGFNVQCRLLSAILSWSWVCWAVTTFLLLASLAAIIFGKHALRSAVHGSGTRRHRGRDNIVDGHHHREPNNLDTTNHYNGAVAADHTNMNMANDGPGTIPQAGNHEKHHLTGTPRYNNTGNAYDSRAVDHPYVDSNREAGAGGPGNNTGGGVNMTQRDREFDPVGAPGSVNAAQQV